MTGHQKISKRLSLFKRLLKDEGGNTIIFMGAALIPILALIGGGVDASRGYMAKSRLQQACDAATLAGRRAVGDGVFNTNALQQANRLFSANFAPDFLGSQNTVFTATSESSGNIVRGVATTELPTVIMRIFGNTEISLSVECEASLDVANADIMMVLDVTGSMSRAPDNSFLGVNADGSARAGSRMRALQDASKSFYDVLNNATSTSNARIRYGFVPYSNTVNVGRLIAGNTTTSLLVGDNVSDEHVYPTRVAVYDAPDPSGAGTTTIIPGGTTTTSDVISDTTATEQFQTPDGRNAFLSAQDCNLFGRNLNVDPVTGNTLQAFDRNGNLFDQFLTTTDSPVIIEAGSTTTTITYDRPRQRGRATRVFFGVERRRCDRRVRTVVTETPTTTTTTDPTTVFVPDIIETTDSTLAGATFKRFDYMNISLPVNDYARSIVSGNPAVQRPSERGDETAIFDRWQGCIEERNTVAADPDDISFSTIFGISPGGATDLDIDSLPADDSNRWRPYWPEIIYNRTTRPSVAGDNLFNPLVSGSRFTQDAVSTIGEAAFIACPAESRLMEALTEAEFDTYIDSLKPAGNTYHDIGAIWGARLASPDGIFAANVNEVAPNNGFVARNLIYLTDGTLQPNSIVYSAYGTEFQNPRVAPSRATGNQLRERHDARFLATCEAIKAKRIRIFVVAFGTALTPSLQACSSPDSAFVADDADQLNDRFLQIATNIADLRLTN